MKVLTDKLRELAVVPVVKLQSADTALDVADALIRGGLPCAEITFRTDAAAESIRLISESRPDFTVGAGTVLTPEQADAAKEAGAVFAVSPGFNPRVVSRCIEIGLPIFPGVCTPTEVEAAMEMGLEYLKFFPAEAAGGVKMLKALAGPYAHLRFMPTGGVTTGNLADYLGCPNVFACGGTWIVPAKELSEGRFDKIEELAREAAELAGRAKR